MIEAKFYRNHGSYCGFSVSGHAGYADFGQDIVCAGVSSALQLTANAVTEVLGIPADVAVLEDRIDLNLPRPVSGEAVHFLEAFRLQLAVLAEDYPKRIRLTDLEV